MLLNILLVHNASREKRKEGRKKDRQTRTVILNSRLEECMECWSTRYIGVS